MCNKCQENNCGCSEKKIQFSVCNECPPEPCSCPVIDLSTNCIILGEELPCSGIEEGLNFTEALKQLDTFICESISGSGSSTNLVNIGTGSKVYKGIDGIGQREIRSLTSSDNTATITEQTNTIDISVNQNNIVKSIVIDVNDLPEDYDEQDIEDYILALPAGSRTILPTDSKLNIIIVELTS